LSLSGECLWNGTLRTLDDLEGFHRECEIVEILGIALNEPCCSWNLLEGQGADDLNELALGETWLDPLKEHRPGIGNWQGNEVLDRLSLGVSCRLIRISDVDLHPGGEED